MLSLTHLVQFLNKFVRIVCHAVLIELHLERVQRTQAVHLVQTVNHTHHFFVTLALTVEYTVQLCETVGLGFVEALLLLRFLRGSFLHDKSLTVPRQLSRLNLATELTQMHRLIGAFECFSN